MSGPDWSRSTCSGNTALPCVTHVIMILMILSAWWSQPMWSNLISGWTCQNMTYGTTATLHVEVSLVSWQCIHSLRKQPEMDTNQITCNLTCPCLVCHDTYLLLLRTPHDLLLVFAFIFLIAHLPYCLLSSVVVRILNCPLNVCSRQSSPCVVSLFGTICSAINSGQLHNRESEWWGFGREFCSLSLGFPPNAKAFFSNRSFCLPEYMFACTRMPPCLLLFGFYCRYLLGISHLGWGIGMED